jgi:dTMP kinase
LLEAPVETALRRRMAKSHEVNRLDREAIQFHTRVREAYHTLVAAEPARWRVIDADRAEDEVWTDVWQTVVSSVLFAQGLERPQV